MVIHEVDNRGHEVKGTAVRYGGDVSIPGYKSECEKVLDKEFGFGIMVHPGNREVIKICENENRLILPDGREYKVVRING
jgi:hypothetical protein